MTTFIPSITLPAAVFANPVASVLLPIALGTAVGFSVRPKETQKTYLALKQPPFRPAPWVFGPAWTLLYGLMGYSAYRAYNVGTNPLSPASSLLLTKQGATLYTIQLGLNLVWMPLFFVAQRPIEATVDILALSGTVGYLTYVWGQVDAVAGWALAPYLGWLGFASYLTVGVGYLNGWDFSDKEVAATPKGKDTKWVDEEE